MDCRLVTVAKDGTIYPFDEEEGQRCVLVPVDAPPRESLWRQCWDFLEKLLSHGDVPATTAVKACKVAGFSPSIIRQCKMRMGLVSKYTGRPHKTGRWEWSLPEEEEEDPYVPDMDAINARIAKMMKRR